MEEVKFLVEEDGNGMFYIMEDGSRVAELQITLENGILSANHTEVQPRAEGKGYGKKLFNAMVAYVREHGLRIKAYCPFVLAQLKRNADEYREIWVH